MKNPINTDIWVVQATRFTVVDGHPQTTCRLVHRQTGERRHVTIPGFWTLESFGR